MTDAPALIPLPADIPVTMPDLPPMLEITTHEQMRALGDAVRTNITKAIQYQPLTAKTIAQRLSMSPGTVGHHLHVLERAGLVQVVALRLVRGTVAKYYTRTARMYGFPVNAATDAAPPIELDMATHCRDEIVQTVAEATDDTVCIPYFPHAIIAPDRVEYYADRIDALITEFLAETPTPDGKLMGFGVFLFTAPAALQPDTATDNGQIDAEP
jgi:DNA-binding transcriptional ArsR family regulator